MQKVSFDIFCIFCFWEYHFPFFGNIISHFLGNFCLSKNFLLQYKMGNFPSSSIGQNSRQLVLAGPRTAYHYKKDGKNIFMFGDFHGHKDVCKDSDKYEVVKIQDYIEQLIMKRNVFVDFFIECSMDRVDVPHVNLEPHNYIKYTDKKILKCLRDNRCEKVRYWYADSRRETDRSIRAMIDTLSTSWHIVDDDTKRLNLEMIYKWMWKNESTPSARKELEQYFKSLSNPSTHTLPKEFPSEIQTYFVKYVALLATQMDDSLLEGLLNPISEYSLVYAGDAHINVYKKVLEKQGWTLVSEGRPHSIRCVIIPSDFWE